MLYDPPQSSFASSRYSIPLASSSYPTNNLLLPPYNVYAISVVELLLVMCIKLSILFSYNRVFSNRSRFLIYEPGRDRFNKSSAYRSTTSPRERTTELLSLTPNLSRIGRDGNSCLRQNLHMAIPLVTDLVNDIAILLLPAAGLWNLQMARVKKFSAYSALYLGVEAIVWANAPAMAPLLKHVLWGQSC